MFFPTPDDFRAWLEKHYDRETELWVGFYKKRAEKRSTTLPEAVEEALCFGWIDGRLNRLDEDSYMIRFTPRRKTSNWSAVNIERVDKLKRLGRMTPAGLRAFEARSEKRTGTYSYENRHAARLTPPQQKRFRAEPEAWKYFNAQPPWYRTAATWWVVSAKKEETRAKRLARLIEDSANGRKLRHLTRG